MRKQVPIILTFAFHFSYRNVIRLSLRALDEKHNAEKKNDFLKAWKLIKELPPTNPNSFWSIASYHGMPFKSRDDNSSGTRKDQTPTWGGYCQHANVLFPFWHRLYILRLEQALQSVLERGNERVALHYWDETSKESKSEGLPHIVTAEHVCIDGEYVRNPLLEFELPLPIENDVETSDTDSKFYVKPTGYQTCRYPYSGIRNPLEAAKAAKTHNEKFDERPETAQSLLQENIIGYLKEGVSKKYGTVAGQFKHCLETTDYNPFSNTSSVTIFPGDHSLEQPHNDLHLAIGGFTPPTTNEDGSVKLDAQGNFCWDGPIEGANGDMGANEVASYDPVFFLHHCNIDRMLWVWQKKHMKTDPDTLTIDTSDHKDKGISNSGQGATPNQTWGETLNKDTILYPFQDEYGVPRKSKDCINIISQLGYDYSIGSLDHDIWPIKLEKRKTVSLLDKPSTPWQDILEKLGKEINDYELLCRSPSAPRQRYRMIFDRTQLTSPPADPAHLPGFPDLGIPMFPTVPIVHTNEGVRFKFKNFVQVSDVNKDKISGSFLVQVFYKANEKLYYYLGQRGVLSRWNRSNCANCQGRKMAHISIPIGGDIDIPIGGDIPRPIGVDNRAQYDPQNLEVHLVYKDGFTGKYIRERYAGKDLVPKAARRSAPGEQEPLLRVVGVFELDLV